MDQAGQFRSLDLKSLTWKEHAESWSILECLEHLNLYGDYYLPQIEYKIKSTGSVPVPEFSSGLLGSYFANSMLPKEKLNKMKTFKDKNPLHANLDKSVIDRFISQQLKLTNLLKQSLNVNLNKVKIETSITRLIKLKLGDTFQFIVNHNIRHFYQIDKIKIAMSGSLGKDHVSHPHSIQTP